ncbi:transmembrane protein 262 [Platysternon megacephalum]|uniref:Transmembrane protein 262 n=1 Tax=Platysternon megacephalum TaxID=55544 RepID=A0A4D9EZE0_9SAUR|nr:transmembrane protein 262 [Platysternon megacephalum]
MWCNRQENQTRGNSSDTEVYLGSPDFPGKIKELKHHVQKSQGGIQRRKSMVGLTVGECGFSRGILTRLVESSSNMWGSQYRKVEQKESHRRLVRLMYGVGLGQD